MRLSKTIVLAFLLLQVCFWGESLPTAYSLNKNRMNSHNEFIDFLRKADKIKLNITYTVNADHVIGYKNGVGIAALNGNYNTINKMKELLGGYYSLNTIETEIEKLGLYVVDDQIGCIMAEGEDTFLIDKNSKFDFILDEPTKKFIKINMGNENGDRYNFYYTLLFINGHWLITDEVDEDNVKTFKNYSLSIRSSSDLFDDGIPYEATNIWDLNPTTAWVPESKDKNGIGEWLDFSFYPAKIVKSIQIINGYAKNSTIYYANNRVKSIRLSFDDGTVLEKELRDGQFGFQSIQFPKPIKVEYIRITIVNIYPGTKYHDTCISEVSFQ